MAENKYTETSVDSDDANHNILDMLAEGKPWIFFTIDLDKLPEILDVKMDVGNGVTTAGTARLMLQHALRGLPEEDE